MYYIPVETCRLIVNVITRPWECLTKYKPVEMCDNLRSMFGHMGGDMFFDVVAHPVIKNDGIYHRAYITVMNKDPELVLGVVVRAVLKDMILTLYFTDEFGDKYCLHSVSFRTAGTEGLHLDSDKGLI